jgi:hypothetical protein
LEADLELLYVQKYKGSLTVDLDHRLSLLEVERNKFLLAEEESWRQKSRAIWIKSGDNNTKFFHRFASYRRNKKHLWDITDDDGRVHSGQDAIKNEVVSYFHSFFQDTGQPNLRAQLETISLYPKLVLEEEVSSLEQCTLEELSEVLKGFSKDKSPGPDGWTVEFFLHFFDMVGPDLLAMVEDTRIRGEVFRPINSTFIALIPKTNHPTSFSDFRPIALCNLCYKIITKIIARRIRPILSRTLSDEQLGFLKGRQILDAIGTTHECLHNIKAKKLQAVILKLDLKKAYDCTNWDYLRLMLLHCGFGHLMTKWIMGCVASTTYAILINGEATKFFNSGRGLRQGCPLSPLLFILVMEGLSLSLKKSHTEGKLTGIKVSRMVRILHLLFVDDVLIMSKASFTEWKEIHTLLNAFMWCIWIGDQC